jgi:hypothetical protein
MEKMIWKTKTSLLPVHGDCSINDQCVGGHTGVLAGPHWRLIRKGEIDVCSDDLEDLMEKSGVDWDYAKTVLISSCGDYEIYVVFEKDLDSTFHLDYKGSTCNLRGRYGLNMYTLNDAMDLARCHREAIAKLLPKNDL